MSKEISLRMRPTITHMRRHSICRASWPMGLILICFASAAAAQNMTGGPVMKAPSTAPVSAPSLLDMPLVSAEQGQRFQLQRQVAASSVSIKTPSLTTQNISSVDELRPAVKQALGHALPTNTTSPLGFPRADFAVGKAAPAVGIQGATSANPSGVNQTLIR